MTIFFIFMETFFFLHLIIRNCWHWHQLHEDNNVSGHSRPFVCLPFYGQAGGGPPRHVSVSLSRSLLSPRVLCFSEQMQSRLPLAASLNTAISFNNSSFANLNELFLSWPHVGEYWTLLLHHIREKMQLLQPIYVCVLKLKIGDRRFLTLCVGGCWSNLWCNLCLGTSTACIVL